MTGKELKKLLQEHPYLIDSMFVRSRSEAMSMALASNITIEEFIERSRKRSSLLPETWNAFSEALARKRPRFIIK
ncbi:MAG TPA: hypothetical protein VN608_10545 [Clostridia bacterium]|nr:hypothetical protein [Clostridia bacterium]